MTGIPSDIDNIISIVKDLPLKETLIYLTTHGIYDFGSDTLGKLKQIIIDKQNQNRYAFVPNKKEADQLKNFSDDIEYNKVRDLVPHYKNLDLIRTGLLIKQYHNTDSNEDRNRVEQIKRAIKHRPNGARLLKIANLPTTPFFRVILDTLYEFKASYSSKQIEAYFEESIDNWEESSKLVTNEDTEESIIEFCEHQMAHKKPYFFLLGMRMAADKVTKVVDKLEKKRELADNNYTKKTKLTKVGNQPRLEVTFIRNID